VVFNHTAEGDDNGATICFRGIDNSAYYLLESNRSRYANYSGTGNTLNANHSQGFSAYFIFSAYWEPLEFELPPVGNGKPWSRWIDTSLDSPNDIVPWQESPAVTEQVYQAGPRSVVVLWTDSPVAREE